MRVMGKRGYNVFIFALDFSPSCTTFAKPWTRGDPAGKWYANPGQRDMNLSSNLLNERK